MGNLDSLPVEIILDILKRVDIDSVIQSRLVSRTWNFLVYHHLLDYLKETQMEFQRQAKEIELKWSLSGRVDEIKPQVDPMLCFMSICFRKLEEIMEFIKEIMEFFNQDVIDVLKNCGGTNALFEYGKLLLLINFTDTELKRYLICLHSKERVECLDLFDCLELVDCIDEWLWICERKRYLLKKLQQPQSTYLASGIRAILQPWRVILSAGPFAILSASRPGIPVVLRAWRIIVSAGPFAILSFFLFYYLYFFVIAGPTAITK
ncbi:hypothetical protein MKW98_001634 [Papaver atlanticum]|uniref:F-box domain-containing protein n=1 Tax=Papaver atlanticum TaxID=357466 RepID=A0AAD4S896_9MAGN|nr:hypothetical protein MKW98_001634 [Papaver atlanticum]